MQTSFPIPWLPLQWTPGLYAHYLFFLGTDSQIVFLGASILIQVTLIPQFKLIDPEEKIWPKLNQSPFLGISEY